MIEPVFPLAPKITYMAFKATGDIIASASLDLLKRVSNALRTIALLSVSPGECIAKHGKAADRFGLGRLVLQNVPMLFKNAAFEPDDVGCDPGGGPSHPREAAMRNDVIAFCNDELVLIAHRYRH